MLQTSALTPEAAALPGLRCDNINHTVLATILNKKAELLANFVPAEMPVQGSKDALPEHRSLKAALSKPGRNFIFECKRASPSLGDINVELDFERIVQVYNTYGSAISVLTEPFFFKGSYEYLRFVKARTHLPVLLKDFVVDEREIYNAKAIGADALLLMTSVLTKEQFRKLYKLTYELGLEALCEVSDEEEALFAREMGCEVIGINNRNLKTLHIDLGTYGRLSEYFAGSDSVLVSESGIKKHADIKNSKAHNFLIGSAICGEDNPDFAVKKLCFGMNKICGLGDTQSVQIALDNHAALGGLIFAPQSPRCVTLDKARELMAVDTKQELQFCGVFVNEELARVTEIIDELNLPFVQLHGQESPEYISELMALRPYVQIIKAIAVKDASFIDTLQPYAALYQDNEQLYFLFDSKQPGSGRSFDHSLLDQAEHSGRFMPERSRCLLSGGIGPDNAAAAAELNFAGLDFNSRLESAPGHKDRTLAARAFTSINL